VISSPALGVIIGLVGAPFMIESLPIALATRCPEWVPPVVLGVLGWGQGLERGWQLRLQAQAALCQLQIEENTRPPARS